MCIRDRENTGKEKKKKKEKASEEKEALSRLQLEFEEHKQQHLRVLAEYDNFRKRTQNEKMCIRDSPKRGFDPSGEPESDFPGKCSQVFQ